VKFFKYQPCAPYSLENLRARKIWFSPPIEFNDPFDCALQVVKGDWDDVDVDRGLLWVRKHVRLDPADDQLLDDPTSQPQLREMVRELLSRSLDDEIERNLNQRGVACFAEEGDSLLMWSHYANGHRGFCLEFDSPGFRPDLRPVRYCADVPALNPLDFLEGTGAKESLVEAMMLSKAQCWEYEREWRILAAEGRWAFEYRPTDLTCVYLGAAMPAADVDTVHTALAGSPARVVRMQRQTRRFALERNE
jgi:Protein of unknown function (DUF2971)